MGHYEPHVCQLVVEKATVMMRQVLGVVGVGLVIPFVLDIAQRLAHRRSRRESRVLSSKRWMSC